MGIILFFGMGCLAILLGLFAFVAIGGFIAKLLGWNRPNSTTEDDIKG